MLRPSHIALGVLLSFAVPSRALAQQYAPGITDTEIKFGNIMPYSGPASALSVTGRVFSAYFDMINERGGVNGRKLNMISLDDYRPIKDGYMIEFRDGRWSVVSELLRGS